MRRLLLITGPTATGKTILGIKLAKEFNGEIVSADSRQIYKGLNIGTGKDLPKNAVYCDGYYLVDGVKIWLYDVVEPKTRFSAGEYAKLARKTIEKVIKQGRLPIVVGGTGFYIKALLGEQILSSVDADWELRSKLEQLSIEKLRDKLKNLDSKRLEQMNNSDKQNPRRLVRAIEIATATTAKESVVKSSSSYDVLKIGLKADLGNLYRKIDKRVDKRYKKGIVDEIRELIKDGCSWDDAGFNSLGYKQWRGYLEGEETVMGVLQSWKYAEHGYARRQLTYFKKDKDIIWFDSSQQNIQEAVGEKVRRWYDGVDN